MLCVFGILQVQAERLDLEYIRTWAEKLGLTLVFERALSESRRA